MRLNFRANSFVFGCTNREIVPRTFSVNLQAENVQNASEFHGKQLCFWTHKSWKCTQNILYKACKAKTSKMRLNFTADSFVFGCKNQENAPTTFSVTLQGENFQDGLNFTANRFVFGRTTHEIVPRTFSVKLAGRELPKCVWTSQQIPSFLDAKIEKMRPELFLTCKVKTSKIRLDFTASSFVFAHKTCENAPKTFLWTLEADNSKNVSELHGKQLCCETQKLGKCAQNFFINLATGEFPNNVWTFNMLWPENGFNRENMSRTSLKNI